MKEITMTKKREDARAYPERLKEARPVRKFWMSYELHTAASSYARANHSTLSELIREQLVDIKANPLNQRRMTDYDSPSSSNSVSVSVEDELFLGAKDAAYPTRNSLTSLVRRRLLKILESEGLWQRAA
jgi:hypothetical protein